MTTLHEKLTFEHENVLRAVEAYNEAVEKIQSECTHPIVLRYWSDSSGDYFRVCEECGYHERSWHDAFFAGAKTAGNWFTNKNLVMNRTYDVVWRAYDRASPVSCTCFQHKGTLNVD